MLQAAPGRLLELIDVVKKHAALAAAGGEAAPVIMRHSQGDHWDLAVLWPMDDWGAYYSQARVAKREAAARASGRAPADVERELDPLVSWHEDLYLRGPSVEALRAHVKDDGPAPLRDDAGAAGQARGAHRGAADGERVQPRTAAAARR